MSGGAGPALDAPAEEKLLLTTCTWLLGRDDQLTNEKQPWQYPRVQFERLPGEDAGTEPPLLWNLWFWGAQIGLPGVFLFLGAVVLLVRGLR